MQPAAPTPLRTLRCQVNQNPDFLLFQSGISKNGILKAEKTKQGRQMELVSLDLEQGKNGKDYFWHLFDFIENGQVNDGSELSCVHCEIYSLPKLCVRS